MNEFKLPEATTCEVVMLTDQNPTRRIGEYVWVHHAELGLIQIDKGKLTEVKPRLPQLGDRVKTTVGATGRYVGTGHVLYISAQDNDLCVGTFDPARDPHPTLPVPSDEALDGAVAMFRALGQLLRPNGWKATGQ